MVPGLERVTVTPGRMAPEESVAVPPIEPKLPCAIALCDMHNDNKMIPSVLSASVRIDINSLLNPQQGNLNKAIRTGTRSLTHGPGLMVLGRPLPGQERWFVSSELGSIA